MRRKTYTRYAYIVDSVLWTGISLIIYNFTLFKKMEYLSEAFSFILLISLFMLSLFANILTAYFWKRFRNRNSILASNLIPCGIYTYLIYGMYMTGVFRAICIVVMGLAVSIGVGIRLFGSRSAYKRKNAHAKAQMVFLYLRSFAAVICAVILIFRIFLPFWIKTDATHIEHGTYMERTIEGNMDKIRLLQPEEWQKLTNSERYEVLYAVCMIEKAYLGIKNDIIVSVGEMPKGVGGMFDSSDFSINISWKSLPYPEKCLTTCLHEMYHAYQYSITSLYCTLPEEYKDIYLFREARIPEYETEFRNYKTIEAAENEEQLAEYMNQRLELDATAFARERGGYYKSILQEYAGKPIGIEY